MKKYDEYQKLMRYKYGFHSFNLLIALLGLNVLLDIFFEVQWGETKNTEILVFIVISAIFFNVTSVYHNAYFHKDEDVKTQLWSLAIVGGLSLFVSSLTLFYNPESILTNGRVNY